MKPRRLLLGLWLVTLAPACEPAPDPAAESAHTTGPRLIGETPPPLPLPPGATLSVDPNRRLLESGVAPGRVGAFSVTDGSGALEAKVWSCNNWPAVAHPVVQCTVDPDYVLVGGGAWATYGGPGALLTASYPVDPNMLRTWEGRSKDHGVSEPHVLIVYAIGLKISGVSRGTLLGHMSVNQMSSAVSAVPSASAAAGDELIALSAGARGNWTGPGNMLTRLTTGDASSKEHGWSDPSSITHYVISIATLVGSHSLEGGSQLAQVSGSGRLTAQVTLQSGFVPTGVSALGTYDGVGRLLTRVAPFSASQYFAESKDHLIADSGQLFTILHSLRQRP